MRASAERECMSYVNQTITYFMSCSTSHTNSTVYEHTAILHTVYCISEQLPNHRRRNLKAFEEHIQKHVSYHFFVQSDMYRTFLGYAQSAY